MWNTDAAKDQSTTVSVSQKAGYTFSLAQTLANHAAQQLLLNSSYSSTLDTKTLLVLLVIGIALAGVSLLSFLYGVVVLLVTSTPPLVVLRVGYLANISPMLLFTISSAKITALADKMTGTTDIGGGLVVHA
jgi:hypothetical protein